MPHSDNYEPLARKVRRKGGDMLDFEIEVEIRHIRSEFAHARRAVAQWQITAPPEQPDPIYGDELPRDWMRT